MHNISHSLVFLSALNTTMNSLETVSKEVKQISKSSCLCPFRYDVLEYSLHHGVLCCMGMLQLIRERRVQAWVAKVRRSNLTTTKCVVIICKQYICTFAHFQIPHH